MANAVSNRPSTSSAPRKTSQTKPVSRASAPASKPAARPAVPSSVDRSTVSREAVGKPQSAGSLPNFSAAFKPAQTGAPNATEAAARAPQTTRPGAQVPDRDNPAAIEPNGDLDYYKKRNEDFLRRNPGMEPPDYYMNYGDKYARRFTEELRPQLSERGQQWLDDARQNLQERIEARRAEDPKAFAELERDPEAFRRFAYDTHPGAYQDAGLSSLPPKDLVKIPVTPDRRDLLSPDGIRQIGITGAGVASDWAKQIGGKIADTEVGRAVGEGVRTVADTEVGQKVISGTRAGLGAVRDAGEWVANTEAGQAVGRGLDYVGEKSLQGLSTAANGVVDGVEYVADTRVGKAVGDGARWVAESTPGQWVGGQLNNAWDWLNRKWE